MNTKSDTPETDEQSDIAHNFALDWDYFRECDNESPPMVVLADFARKLEREREMWKDLHYVAQLNFKTADCARMNAEEDLDRLRSSIRNLRNAKGRHNTQIATERLFAMLPD